MNNKNNQIKNENQELLERARKAVVPTNDYIFKKIFGRVGKEVSTKA